MVNDIVSQLIRAVVTPKSPSLYVVVDAARDDRIYDLLQELDDDARCLYRGRLPEPLARAAPYLVRLRRDSAFGRAFRREGWSHGWGIVVKSNRPMDDLFRHFRTLLIVQDAQKKKLLFRFYDPRVLSSYLPTCTSDELETVFGPVETFYTRCEGQEEVSRFLVEDGTLTQKAHIGQSSNDRLTNELSLG